MKNYTFIRNSISTGSNNTFCFDDVEEAREYVNEYRQKHMQELIVISKKHDAIIFESWNGNITNNILFDRNKDLRTSIN